MTGTNEFPCSGREVKTGGLARDVLHCLGTGMMDVGKLKVFQMAMTKMEWASQRQKLLSQNVVNANTPGYAPQDLKSFDFKKTLRSAAPVQVAMTNPKHSKGTIPQQETFRNREVRRNFEVSPDGNQVILEEQMQKVGSTRSEYNQAVTLMQSHMKMLKMALGKGGGA